VSVDDFVHQVNEALSRADSLFGSASPDGGLAADQLADAVDTLWRSTAPDMAGAAVAGYRTFAQQRASALGRLASADAALNRALQAAASAENTAAATSRSTVATAAAHVDGLANTPGGQRALIAALHSEVERQQDLVRRHQQQAVELSEQVRLLSYD
jgi:peptidoglycan DL-endopeptidase CwlO